MRKAAAPKGGITCFVMAKGQLTGSASITTAPSDAKVVFRLEC